jgi:hypothetical protein
MSEVRWRQLESGHGGDLHVSEVGWILVAMQCGFDDLFELKI